MRISQKLSERQDQLNNIVRDIATLCSSSRFSAQDFPVHLVMTGSDSSDAQGWYSIEGKKIALVLESSSYRGKKEIDFLLLVLAHEFFHIALKRSREIVELIERVARKQSSILLKLFKTQNPKQALEELLISSFIPEGYLAFHYMGLKIRLVRGLRRRENGTADFITARRYCAYKMKDLAQEYVMNKHVIDQRYLHSLIDKIKRDSEQ